MCALKIHAISMNEEIKHSYIKGQLIYMYQIFFIQLLVDEQIYWLKIFAIVNKAKLKIRT